MKRAFAYSLILMLIAPIFTVLRGLQSRNLAYKKWLLIAFITLFGSIMILGSSDGAVHLGRVTSHYTDLSFGQFWEELIGILKFQSQTDTKGDLYIHFLSFFVGGILGVPKLFFVIVSFIYGFFYVSSLLKVLTYFPKRASYLFYAFVFVFIFWKGLDGINTVRTWTGAWVLFYGAISYFETRKRRYLLLVAVTPFIHFAYFLMSLPVWMVVIFKSRPKLYTVIFSLSFFITLNSNLVTRNLASTDLGQNKVAGYYEEGSDRAYNVSSRTKGNLYVRLGKRGTNFWSINVLAFLIIGLGIYWKRMTTIERQLFSVGILSVAVANVNTFIPALFNRTMNNAGIYLLAVTVLLLASRRLIVGSSARRYLVSATLGVSLLLFVPFLLFQVSNLINFFSLFMVALPIIPLLFEGVNLSFRDFIGWFI